MPDDPAAPVADPAAPAEPAATSEPAKPAEPETATLPRAEVDALRRRVAEAEKAQRKYEADRKKAEEERQAEQGQYKELAEMKDRELQSERAERTRFEREQRITRLASRAKFIDPSDVVGRITAEEGADDASVETALERIAENSPHLIAKEAPAVPEIGQVHTPSAVPDAGPTPPPGKAPLRSQADVEALSDKEFQDRYAEVQAVLTAPQ